MVCQNVALSSEDCYKMKYTLILKYILTVLLFTLYLMYKVWYLLWNFISQYISWKMCMFAFLLLQGYSILLSDSRGTFLTLSCFPPSCQNSVFLFVYWRTVFSMALIPLPVFQPSLVICISLSLSHSNVYFLVWTLYLTPFNYFKDDVMLQSVCGWFGRWRKRAHS